MTVFSFLRAVHALLAASVVLSSPLAHAEDVLRVSAIPDEAPTELQRKFGPLGKYLEGELGMKVSFVPVSDYAYFRPVAVSGVRSQWQTVAVASPRHISFI